LVNCILCVSVVLWIIVHARNFYSSDTISNEKSSLLFSHTLSNHRGRFKNTLSLHKISLPPNLLELRRQREIEGKEALGKPGVHHYQHKRNKMRKTGSAEKPPVNCSFASWQLLTFPNCMEFHSIDLELELGMQKKKANHLSYGYIGSGYWRDTWKLPYDRDEIVLKMMKMEFPTDERNIDRHRRDSLVMERLTSDPYIVTSYGYCATSTITEFIHGRLDKLIFPQNDGNDDNNLLPSLYKNMYLKSKENKNAILTRETELGRLRLALVVSKAVDSLHTKLLPPVVHADLQLKQFLYNTHTGEVKLNDFNRCRFVAIHNHNHKQCPMKIATASGRSRSPEEYRFTALTEKMDVFSLGHVLFNILTGSRPLNHLSTSMFKKDIIEGIKPFIDHIYKQKPSDAAIANLISRTYTLNPVNRINTSELVFELEKLANNIETS